MVIITLGSSVEDKRKNKPIFQRDQERRRERCWKKREEESENLQYLFITPPTDGQSRSLSGKQESTGPMYIWRIKDRFCLSFCNEIQNGTS